MPYLIISLDEAKTVLDYFNGFHDGFIKQLTVISHDKFESRGVQASGERLTLEITFAHYNYQQDTKPADQRIRARLDPRGNGSCTRLSASLSAGPNLRSFNYQCCSPSE